MGKFLIVFNVLRLTGYVTEPLLDSEQIHAVVGEPSRVMSPPAIKSELRVVSWNIEQGTRYERIREALAALDADVYLLQEVDRGVRRSDYRDVARDLAHDLELNWVFAGEFQEIGQGRRSAPAITGQAVLSRYPIERAMALPFRNQANLRWRLDPLQPRRGGRMALRAESGGTLLYNAHIESARDDRFRSKQIEEVLLDHGQLPSAPPVVFAGDFNTGAPPRESIIVRQVVDDGFVDALGSADAGRRTSINHRDPLDWIFVRNASPRSGRVIDVPRASDHFPLTAVVAVAAHLRLGAQ